MGALLSRSLAGAGNGMGAGGRRWGVSFSSESQGPAKHYYPQKTNEKTEASMAGPWPRFAEGTMIGTRACPGPSDHHPAWLHHLPTLARSRSFPASYFSLMSSLYDNHSWPFYELNKPKLQGVFCVFLTKELIE